MAKYMTKQRRAMLEYLEAHAHQELSARDIASALEGAGVSVSAVYRNIGELESEGKLRRVGKKGEREAMYRYFAASGCENHLHLSCSLCGRTYHMPVDATERLVAAVDKNSGFEIDRSGTVLYGVCRKCRKGEHEKA